VNGRQWHKHEPTHAVTVFFWHWWLWWICWISLLSALKGMSFPHMVTLWSTQCSIYPYSAGLPRQDVARADDFDRGCTGAVLEKGPQTLNAFDEFKNCRWVSVNSSKSQLVTCNKLIVFCQEWPLLTFVHVKNYYLQKLAQVATVIFILWFWVGEGVKLQLSSGWTN